MWLERLTSQKRQQRAVTSFQEKRKKNKGPKPGLTEHKKIKVLVKQKLMTHDGQYNR